MKSQRFSRQARVGTVLCAVCSLLSMTPFFGVFFLPAALLGGLRVWFSQLSIKAKLVRGFLPLVVPILLYRGVVDILVWEAGLQL